MSTRQRRRRVGEGEPPSKAEGEDWAKPGDKKVMFMEEVNYKM